MKYVRFLITSVVIASAALITPAEEPQQTQPTAAPTIDPKERFEDLFTPFRTESAALSPDGKYIAYTVRESELLSVLVLEIDNPSKAVAKVTVVSDEAASPTLDTQAKEKTSAAIRWMRWTSPTRLMLETNRNYTRFTRIGFVEHWINCAGDIVGIDANGENSKVLITPEDVGESVQDPTYVSTGTNSGRETLLSISQSEEGAMLSSDLSVKRWLQDRAQTGQHMFFVPNSPHIVDLCPDIADTVILRADGVCTNGTSRETRFYQLNTVSGKLKEISHENLSISSNYLFDKTGHAKISIANSVRDKFPHKFLYNSETFLNRWKPLDDISHDSVAARFLISPENYFGERSVPLVFDNQSNIFYFASNVGRDKYGLYAFDFKTGMRTHLSAENQEFDLYIPNKGLFPDEGQYVVRTKDNSPDVQFTDSFNAPLLDNNNDPQLAGDGSGSSMAAGNSVDPTTAAIAKNMSDFLFKKIDAQLKYTANTAATDNQIFAFDRFSKKLVGIRYEGRNYTCSWFLPELQSAQRFLEQRFPTDSIDILEWDQQLQRFLVRVRGIVDSGAYYIFEPAKGKLIQFAQRSPTLAQKKLHEVTYFSFPSTTGGRTISGFFTFPSTTRTVPVPVVVLCASYPWERFHADYQPELQAFAEMGIAVIQVNNRGAWGFGLQHRDAIRPGYEESQVEDIIAAVDFLSKRVAINAKRVAVVGKQYGGYVAIRALQLYPQRFRGAVAIDAMLDPDTWIKENRWTRAESGPALIKGFLGSSEKLSENLIMNKADTITKPVLLLNYRGYTENIEKSAYTKADRLVAALGKNGIKSELYPLTDDYFARLPKAQAEVFQHIEDFLNTYIYEYKVEFGELKKVKDE